HVTEDLAEILRSQVVSTVRFSECLTDMASTGIDTYVHVGPGDVTAAMAKRTVEDAITLVVSSPQDVDEAVGAIVSIG
ncbi:MAG: hypothetical protein WCE80_10840, partial [Acidimicrobiia bacterium]